jgi:hypothetical protein
LHQQESAVANPPVPSSNRVQELTGIRQPDPNPKRCASSKIITIAEASSVRLTCPSCMSWRCNYCRPRLLWKWASHLVGTFFDHPGDFYLATAPRERWHATKVAIGRRRKGFLPGLYVRLGDTFISTSPVDVFDAKPMCAEYASRFVGDYLLGYDPWADSTPCRPVVTSNAWCLPKTPTRPKREVHRLGSYVEPEKLRDIIRAEGFPASLNVGWDRWDITVPFDGDPRRLLDRVLPRCA